MTNAPQDHDATITNLRITFSERSQYVADLDPEFLLMSGFDGDLEDIDDVGRWFEKSGYASEYLGDRHWQMERNEVEVEGLEVAR